MAKTKISEFSVTPGDNTDIDGINIDEGCSPANLNNAIRELMSQLKDFQVGNQASNQLAIAGGGTNATTAADARTNLGIGTMGTQSASSVAITGGSITGITDLAIADGGTGASTAADARTNLGLGTMATQAASSVAITGGSITGITDLAIADGGTGASTAADARTNLGLGSIATQSASNISVTGGSITGITDLAVADGGTGASSITSNSVILGNGSSALSGNLVAPGTSGNVLTSNGTTWTSAAPATSVTSLNSQTGAVVTTTLGNIGSVIMAAANTTTALVPGNTISGSNLYYPTSYTRAVGGEAPYSEGTGSVGSTFWCFTAAYPTAGSIMAAVKVGYSGSSFVLPGGNVSTLSGTWRALSPLNARYLYDDGNAAYSYTYIGLFVRVS